MSKILQTVLAVMVLMPAGKASAEIISYNGYTLNEETNIVTGGGLEWLQWDVTLGMSIDSAIADIEDGMIDGVDYGTGWSLASNIQMAAMFNVFGFGADFTWDSDEQTEQWSVDPANNNDGAIEDIVSDPELQFTALFGETEHFSVMGDPNPYSASRALFGNDLDGDSLYNRAEVFDDFSSELGDISGNTWLRLDFTGSDFSWDVMGVALVRNLDSSVPPTSVSEPSVLVIMAIGLLGLMRLRNTKSDQ